MTLLESSLVSRNFDQEIWGWDTYHEAALNSHADLGEAIESEDMAKIKDKFRVVDELLGAIILYEAHQRCLPY